MIKTKSVAINHVYPCMCIATFSRYNQKMYIQHFEKISCIANPGIGSYFVIFQGITTFRKKSITNKKTIAVEICSSHPYVSSDLPNQI